jgi:hypothetical protein
MNLHYTIFYNIILGLGKMTKSQDRFPAIQGYSLVEEFIGKKFHV